MDMTTIYNACSRAGREPKWSDSTQSKFTFRCPTEAHPNGDNNPSAWAYTDEGRLRLACSTHCKSDDIAKALGLPEDYWKGDTLPKQTDRKMKALQGCTVKQLSIRTGLPCTYLEGAELCDIQHAGVDAVLIPYPNDLKRYRVGVDQGTKHLWQNGTSLEGVIYHTREALEIIQQQGWAIICEGETDLLTATFGGNPALALPGAGMLNAASAETIAGITKDVILWIEDRAGYQLIEAARKHLVPAGVTVRVIVAGSTDKLDINGLWHLCGCDNLQFIPKMNEIIDNALSLEEATNVGALEMRDKQDIEAELASNPLMPLAWAVEGTNKYKKVTTQLTQAEDRDTIISTGGDLIYSISMLTNSYPRLKAAEQTTVDEVARQHKLGVTLLTKLTMSDDDPVIHNCMEAIRTQHHTHGAAHMFFESWQKANTEQRFQIEQRAQKIYDMSSDTLQKMLEAGEPLNPFEFNTWDALRTKNLDDYKELPLLATLGSNVFFDGGSHLLVSSPKSGKTHLLFRCAQEWGPVLYFSEESNRTINRYLRNYERTGVTLNPQFRVAEYGGQGIVEVMRIVESCEPGQTIILDTLRCFANIDDENAAREWCRVIRPLISLCKANGHTLICAHHSKKVGGTDPVNASSGNNSLPSLFDQVIYLVKERGDIISLSVTGRLADIYPGAEIRWNNDRLELQRLGHEQKTTIADLVLQVCEPYKLMTMKDIVADVQLLNEQHKEKSIATKVGQLVNSGQLSKNKNGRSFNYLKVTDAGLLNALSDLDGD